MDRGGPRCDPCHTLRVQTPRDNPPKRGARVPSDFDRLVALSLTQVRHATNVDLAFVGTVTRTAVRLNAFDGEVAGPLRGAVLDVGHGLGGRVAEQMRPLCVSDYVRTRSITHAYDFIIRAESLRAMAAVPVVLPGGPVAVLYAAMRTTQMEMGRVMDVLVREARNLEHRLITAQLMSGATSHESSSLDVGKDAVLTAAHAELRLIAAQIEDASLRRGVLDVAAKLVGDTGQDGCYLTDREKDVLALLAVGLRNREIADRLGIGLYTVKGHVKSIFAKLNASSRLGAVTLARRQQLLP